MVDMAILEGIMVATEDTLLILTVWAMATTEMRLSLVSVFGAFERGFGGKLVLQSFEPKSIRSNAKGQLPMQDPTFLKQFA